jgi:DNA-binding NarL/FixJ family response regulator
VDFIVKEVMLLQMGLEVLLLILLVALLWRSRGKLDQSQEFSPPTDDSSPAFMPDHLKETIERFLSESEKISRAFEANLKDKKELSTDLILKLDRRLADYRSLLAKTEEAIKAGETRLAQLAENSGALAGASDHGQANPAAPETRALVLRLAKKGLSIPEIAERSKLLRGEVELIINLEKDFEV